MSKNLIPAQRRKKIQAYLRIHKAARLADLSEMLNASEATIRRDLEKLEETGFLERTHGGAVISQRLSREPEYQSRLENSPDAKKKIGQLAATLIEDGDVVSIDCGTIKHGFYGDSAYTFAVGNVNEEVKLLLQRTKESLYLAIEQAVVGKRVGDIGYAVQNYCESFGYGVVRDLVGHGVGRNLHEKPEVPNFGRRGTGPKLKEGMCIAIEPMITLGSYDIKQDADGWTIRTIDGLPAAHYEHDLAIRKGKADVLSTFKYIEEVLNKQQ